MRTTLVVGFLLLALKQTAMTQDDVQRDSSPRFDAASIRPCRPQDAATPDEFLRLLAGTTPSGNRYHQPCTTIPQLALFAYDWPRRTLRYPRSIALDFFEVDARSAAPVRIEDIRLMVRQLLADRFGFQSHKEVITADMYTLVLARPDRLLGPNARRAAVVCSPESEEEPRDEKARSHCRRLGRVENGVMTMTYNGMTMSQFAESLPRLDVPIVVDGTGLDGVFDMTLSVDADRSDAALNRALEKQLGLKLVRSKGPVEILVIDRAELPTPN